MSMMHALEEEFVNRPLPSSLRSYAVTSADSLKDAKEDFFSGG